mgnify:CR=1 FL=1
MWARFWAMVMLVVNLQPCKSEQESASRRRADEGQGGQRRTPGQRPKQTDSLPLLRWVRTFLGMPTKAQFCNEQLRQEQGAGDGAGEEQGKRRTHLAPAPHVVAPGLGLAIRDGRPSCC